MDVVWVALAAFNVTVFVRQLWNRFFAFDWRHARTKTQVSAVISLSIAALYATDMKEAFHIGLPAAGLAAIFHRLHRWLGASADAHRVVVLQAVNRRNQR